MSLPLIRQLARRTGTARLSATVGPCHVSLPVVQLNAVRRLPVSRTYASKAKAKSTASFVPGSKQLFESEEVRAEYAKAESKMASVVDWFRKEVAAFETRASGRVTPALLSPVRVERGRGQTVKLEEVATVGIKDGCVLIVTVFDEHVRGAFLPSLTHFFFSFWWLACLLTNIRQNMKAVEQAIYSAKLPHIVPQRLDSRTLKIPIPKSVHFQICSTLPMTYAALQANSRSQKYACLYRQPNGRRRACSNPEAPPNQRQEG